MLRGIWRTFRSPRLLVLPLIGWIGLAEAGVYKWVDEQGRVSFGDRPPQGSGEELSIETTPGAASAAPSERARQDKQKRLLEIYQEDRERKKREVEQRRRVELQRQANCDSARQRLDGYRYARGIYSEDKDGQRHYLSDQEREAYVQRLADEVKHWCGASP